MRRLLSTFSLAALVALAIAAPAQAAFGLKELDVRTSATDGSPSVQAGSHPDLFSFNIGVNTRVDPETGETVPDEETKDLKVAFPPGFIGDPTAVPRCSAVQFLSGLNGECPDATALGKVRVEYAVGESTEFNVVPVYNLAPSPGTVAKLGFIVEARVLVTIDVRLNPNPPYNVIGVTPNITQAVFFLGAKLTVWGVPTAHSHDSERGRCLTGAKDCSLSLAEVPFLTLPTSCASPLTFGVEADSWQNPNPPEWFKTTATVHDNSLPPNPLSATGCERLDFAPTIASETTTSSAETGSGLDFSVDFHDEGIGNPKGLAESQVKKSEVTFPEGVTINPSVGEGLGVCTPAQLKAETLHSLPGEGCPNASKLGSLHVTTPLVDEAVDGQIFLAQQDDAATTAPGAENPFDSLIALYFVLRNTNLGVIVTQALKVEPDPRSGRLVATLDEIPQLPLGHFEAHLRTGARAALITPAACGNYSTKAVFTPWSNPARPLTTTASFQITRGVGGGPCPPGGAAPFHPHFEAGAVNNNAGSFSPFNMRLIRADGEQDMTKFSSILPPGELGSLAGVSKCPDSAIAIAKAKTGRQELASPSCPANSLIGHTLAGAGVGEALTYVGGEVYLGGPFHGDPLSVISVTPAVAGPFDAGTVVVRLALTLNPKTAEVEVDGANSDPIPHILKGIVLKVRDLRVYVDRPNFTLNPTSCDESSAKATLFGSYLDVFNPADDVPVNLSSRYQAANCLNLGFKPNLALKLEGGTKRGGHPGLLATYTPRKGDANVKGLVVRLPRSAFLDQAHIRTICTRVQFAAKACPAGAQYGFIKAWTPLLDTPLEGPVYLRSSNHKLPDLVFDLHGLVDIEVATRIDSAQGGIRATVESTPDAPLSKVLLRMQGGKKGLIVNSRNLCGAVSRANVEFSGQNGKQSTANPVMRADCGGKRKHKRSRH